MQSDAITSLEDTKCKCECKCGGSFCMRGHTCKCKCECEYLQMIAQILSEILNDKFISRNIVDYVKMHNDHFVISIDFVFYFPTRRTYFQQMILNIIHCPYCKILCCMPTFYPHGFGYPTDKVIFTNKILDKLNDNYSCVHKYFHVAFHACGSEEKFNLAINGCLMNELCDLFEKYSGPAMSVENRGEHTFQRDEFKNPPKNIDIHRRIDGCQK